jgi:hypothetical protein
MDSYKKRILWYLRGNKHDVSFNGYNYGLDFFAPLCEDGKVLFHTDKPEHITQFNEIARRLSNGGGSLEVYSKNDKPFVFAIDNHKLNIFVQHDHDFVDIDEERAFYIFLGMIQEMIVVSIRDTIDPQLKVGILQTISESINRDKSIHYNYYHVNKDDYEDVPIIETIAEVHHLTKTIHNTYSGGETSWWFVYNAFKPTHDLQNRLGVNNKYPFSNWLLSQT